MQLHHASALVPINQLLNTFNQAYLAPHFASEPDTISIISNPNSDPNFYCGNYFRTKLCVRFSVDFFCKNGMLTWHCLLKSKGTPPSLCPTPRAKAVVVLRVRVLYYQEKGVVTCP